MGTAQRSLPASQTLEWPSGWRTRISAGTQTAISRARPTRSGFGRDLLSLPCKLWSSHHCDGKSALYVLFTLRARPTGWMSMKEFIVQALQASKWSLQLSFTSIGRPSGLGRQVVSFISGGIPALRARHAEGQGQTVAEASRMCSRLLEPEDDACRCSRSPGYYGTKCKEPRQMLWLS